LLRIYREFVRALGAGNPDPAFTDGHSQLLRALITVHHPVVYQAEDLLPIETDHQVVTDQKGGNAHHVPHLQFAGRRGIFADVSLFIMDGVLRKELFRLDAMWSGVAGKKDYLLQLVTHLRN